MALKFKKLSGGEAARIYQKEELKIIGNSGILEEFTLNYKIEPTEVDRILSSANLPFNQFLVAQGMPLYSIFGLGARVETEEGVQEINVPQLTLDVVDLGLTLNTMAAQGIEGWTNLEENKYFMLGFNLFSSIFIDSEISNYIFYSSELPGEIAAMVGLNQSGWIEEELKEFFNYLGEFSDFENGHIDFKKDERATAILQSEFPLSDTEIYTFGTNNNLLYELISEKYIPGYELKLKGDYKPEFFNFKATSDGVKISMEDYLNDQTIPVEIKIAPDERPYQLLTAHDYKSFNGTYVPFEVPSNIYALRTSAFEECSYFNNIIIPKNVTEIGDYAFKKCTGSNLVFSIPETVIKIGVGAFEESAIKEFTAPVLLEEISNDMFKNCRSLKTITVNFPLYVGTGCFEGCTNLQNFDLTKLLIRGSGWTITEPAITARLFKNANMSQLKTYPKDFRGIHEEGLYGTKITEFKLPYRTKGYYTHIGPRAFANCTALKTVDASEVTDWEGQKKNSDSIDDNVISEGVFSGCTALETFLPPKNSITYIEDSAFANCKKLTNCTFLPGIRYIGNYAFQKCAALTNIVSDDVVDIGDYAFDGCTSLKTFSFKNVKNIGNYAFRNCSALTTFNSENEREFIWDGSINIQDRSFYDSGIRHLIVDTPNINTKIYWPRLSSVVVKNSVGSTIPAHFLSNLGSTTITLEEGIKKICTEAFYQANSGTKLYLPKSIELIEDFCIEMDKHDYNHIYHNISFSEWSQKFLGIQYTKDLNDDEGGHCYLYCLDESTGDYTNSFIIDENIDNIPDKSFQYLDINSIEFTNPNTTIGTYAFACNDIKSFKFPANLQEIPEGVLKYCHHLDVVEFPIAPTKIDKHAFYNSSEWGSTTDARWSDNIVIPSTVKEIGEGAFYKCSAKAIELPEGLETIGAQCFMGNGITSGNIPSTVTKIGAEAFNGNGLTTLNISSALTEIEDLALVFNKWETITVDENNPVYDSRDNCNSIIETATNKLITGSKNTIIPDGVVEIGDYSIGKTDIEQIIIPDSVTTIGQGAFKDCAKLTSITLPSHIKELKYRTLYNCDLLTTFEMPDDLEVIEQEAMAYCAGLTTVHINDKLSRVKKAEVSFSNSPFYYCNNLTTLYLSKNFSYLIGSTDTSNYSKMFNFSKDTSTSSNYPTITTLYYKGTQEELNQLTKSQVAILHRVDSVYVLNGEGYVLTTDLPVVENAPEDQEEVINTVTVTVNLDNLVKNFDDRFDIEAVIFEEGVETTSEYSFFNCKNLTKLFLPSTLNYLSIYNFKKCNIKEIHFNGSLEKLFDTEINFNIIEGMAESVDYYVLDENGNEILLEGELLVNLDQEKPLVTFYNCSKLTSIKVIGQNNQLVPRIICENCNNITKIYVDSLEQYYLKEQICESNTIKDLFVWNSESKEYEKIIDLIIPEGIQKLRDRTFHCLSIESVIIPRDFNNIYMMNGWIVYGCPNLKYVKFEEGVTSGDYRSIHLGASTEEHKVIIDLPSTLSTIYNEDFHEGAQNKIVWILRSIKPPMIRDGLYAYELYVPDEAIEYYTLASPWKSGVKHLLSEWETNKDQILEKL